ncbi:MAG: ABC transporter permease, partial [Actinomycetota bacterium]
MSERKAPSSALTSFVVASRYMPVYIALLVLVIVAWIWAPATLGRVSVRAIAPYGAVLGIAALGQMLVIMTGGIDLSVPGTMSLAAVIMVGAGAGSDENIGNAIAIALVA